MGRWRLSGSLLSAAILAAALVTACAHSPVHAPTVTSVSTPRSTPATQPPTAVRTPTPSPTPDPLAAIPETPAEALTGVTTALIDAPGEPCPAPLVARWHVACATGDFDGDDVADSAFLVPLQAPAESADLKPAALLVLRASDKQLMPLPGIAATADASALGIAFFGTRQTPAGPALTFLTSACTTTGCISQAHIERWDANAWRDIGPGDSGISNLESADWDADGSLVIKAGALTAPGAGPTRPSTTTYTYADGRYSQSARVYAPPVYLFDAITDADAKFAAADWAGAIAAYQRAIADTGLKDWKAEQGDPPGRPVLVSYALFRIAVATAAMGDDPAVALDAVIVDAQTPIFAYAAQQFRQGWQQTASTHGGCTAVTAYLATSDASGDNPAYIQQVFNYGYANQPAKSYLDICPL